MVVKRTKTEMRVTQSSFDVFDNYVIASESKDYIE